MHLYTIQNYMQHRCIVHIYKLFDKFYVNFIISFDILSNPGFLSLGIVDIWGWIILCWRAVLGTVGCSAASLAFTHWNLCSILFSSVTRMPADTIKCLLWVWGKSHPWLGTTTLQGLTHRILSVRQFCWGPHLTDEREVKSPAPAQGHTASIREGPQPSRSLSPETCTHLIRL